MGRAGGAQSPTHLLQLLGLMGSVQAGPPLDRPGVAYWFLDTQGRYELPTYLTVLKILGKGPGGSSSTIRLTL